MPDLDRKIQGVIVQIFGEEYKVAGHTEEVEQVAAYVDRKMQEVAADAGGLPRAQIAVLAAMNITMELFRAMQERNMMTEKAHESISRLSKLVEERASLFSEAESSPRLERLFRNQPETERDSAQVK